MAFGGYHFLSVPNTFAAYLIYTLITFLFACSYFQCIYQIAIGTLVLCVSPVTSCTILNLFARFKLVVCLFQFICICILVTNSVNLKL